MAVPVFLLLCGLSVGFLVYVLVQFRREGRRSRGNSERDMVFSRASNPNLIVVTHPISLSAQGGISVMPLQLQTRIPSQASALNRDANIVRARVLQMPPSGAREAQGEKTAALKSKAL